MGKFKFYCNGVGGFFSRGLTHYEFDLKENSLEISPAFFQATFLVLLYSVL